MSARKKPAKPAGKTAAERQALQRARNDLAGGRDLHVLLSPRAAKALAILERRFDDGRPRGVTSRAVEHALEVAAQLSREHARRQSQAGILR